MKIRGNGGDNAVTIQDLRAKTGMSQKKFADHLGINYRTLQGWEGGRRPPTGVETMMGRLIDLEKELSETKAALKNCQQKVSAKSHQGS